jgi:hypothetical protein
VCDVARLAIGRVAVWLLMFLSLREKGKGKGRQGARGRIVTGIAFQQQHDEGSSSANSCLAKLEHFHRWIGWFLQCSGLLVVIGICRLGVHMRRLHDKSWFYLGLGY